jgi:hypothetical protein
MFHDMDFKVPDSGRNNLKYDPAPPRFSFLNKDDNPPEDIDEIIADYEKNTFANHMQQYVGM